MPTKGPSAVLIPGKATQKNRFVGCRKSLQLLSLSQVSCHLLVSLILKRHRVGKAYVLLSGLNQRLDNDAAGRRLSVMSIWHKEERSSNPISFESDAAATSLCLSIFTFVS